MSGWAGSTFGALGYREYRILWIGTTLAFLGFMMSFVVQSVVAFDLTGKNAAVGIVGLGQGIATILVSPFGGVIADRVSKRLLVLVGQLTIGLSFFAVGILIVTDLISIPLLVLSTFLLGTVFSFIAPARQAWIGELLPKEAMANGIALQQISQTSSRIFGPLFAGVLVGVAFIGSGGTYLVMSSLFIGVVFTIFQLPKTKSRSGGGKVSVTADMRLGVDHVRERPRLQLLCLSFIVIVLAGFSWQVLLPGLLENELGRSPKDVGWLLTSGAISGLAVTIGLASYAGTRHAWRLMFAGAFMLGLSLALLAVVPNYAAALIVMLLTGAGTALFQMMNNALVMQHSDPAYFGRVMSITMLAWGFNGIAGLPFGIMADAAGERETLMVMGAMVLAALAVTAFVHVAIGRRGEAPLVRPRFAGGK
ncbi:hypothetical protein AYO38_11035 [bacterium SCGC AG-212-C10]|nr:hypothetical protein AYO38_11035 [bacterium SCGC AG-212-C10]